MNKNFSGTSISQDTLKIINLFSKDRRNTIRGVIADCRRRGLQDSDITKIRQNDLVSDMRAAGELLKGPNCLKKRKHKRFISDNLFHLHDLNCYSLQHELSYAAGYLESRSDDTEKALGTIKLLSQISRVDANDTARSSATDRGSV